MCSEPNSKKSTSYPIMIKSGRFSPPSLILIQKNLGCLYNLLVDPLNDIFQGIGELIHGLSGPNTLSYSIHNLAITNQFFISKILLF